ncbi:MAG: choice-of-anchor D domain-containing protein [bacterium]|nr:choice-of-anchor D domain-containing protein [bacterium]
MFFRQIGQGAMVLLFLFDLAVFPVRAEVIYFADDFEKGLDKWYSWDSWGLTNSLYRSGSYSLTDSPDGDYANNADAIVTITGDIDLSASTSPVLTFWHRYSIGWYDYASVEISTDGGETWSELRKLSSGDQSTWTLEQIDLSDYKTYPVKINFRLQESGSYEGDGWYIDDVEIKERDEATLSLPFHDSFENGPGHWIVSGWDWDLTTATSLSGSHCLTDSPDENYPNNARAIITLAGCLDLSASTSPVLLFWHKYSIGWGDYGEVEISTDGGTTWSELKKWSSGDQKTWTLEQIELSNYKTSQVKVRFRLAETGLSEADGWYIDDVIITDIDLSPDQHHPQTVIDSFTADPASGKPPLSVAFICEAHDIDGYIILYRWDFDGDGHMDKTTTTGSISQEYRKRGIYQVNCTLLNNRGAIATAGPLTITIDEILPRIPQIFVAPTSHDFGDVPIGSPSAPQIFTISNPGKADLVIGSITLTPDASKFSLQKDNCSGRTLAPSRTCTLKVVFSPTSPGSKGTNITIASNDPAASTLNLPLRGTAPEIAPLLPPTLVTATAGDGKVTLSWVPVPGETSYHIYWATTSGVSRATGTKISNVTSPYIHSGLKNNTTYYYVVTAENSYSESDESDEVKQTPYRQAATFARIIGKPGYDRFLHLVKAPDGSLISIGSTNDSKLAVVLKFNPEGDIIWQKSFGFDSYKGYFSQARLISSDLAMVSGWAYPLGDYAQDAFLGKLNINTGNMEEHKFYHDTSDGHNWFNDGIIASAGGFIGLGKGWDGQDRLHLIKLDYNLNKKWEKSFSFGSNLNNVGVSIIEDGGYYYLAGFTCYNKEDEGYTTDMVIMKLDSSGNKVWYKVIGGPGNDGGRFEDNTLYSRMSKIIKTQDNHYAFIAQTESFGTNTALLLISFDPDGSIIAARLIDGPGKKTIQPTTNVVAQAPDGSFIVGFTSDNNGVIIKIDSDLTNILWQRRYFAGEYTCLSGVFADNSSLYVVGRVESAGESDALIMKTDLDGHVFDPCVNSIEAGDLTISDVTISEMLIPCQEGAVNTQEVTDRIVTIQDAALGPICVER